MTAEGARSSIVQQILGGDNRELQLLVARGLFPLAPALLVPLQVALTQSGEQQIAQAARLSLAEVDPKILVSAAAEDASEEVLRYFALEQPHPVTSEAILRLRQTPCELLLEMAPLLSPDLQEVLLLRQDAILEEPAILERLEDNPELSAYSKRRIGEYREHLLPRKRAPARRRPALEEEAEQISEEEVAAAIQEARQTPATGEVDDVTGLTETQIRALPVGVRMKLARGASRTLRGILVRDSHPAVARAVIVGSALSESEVEQIAKSRNIVEDVLEAIGRSTQWTRKYSIVHALVLNPRTPAGLAIRLLPRLSVRDLRALRRDRNVPDAVRSRAARLYRIKTV